MILPNVGEFNVVSIELYWTIFKGLLVTIVRSMERPSPNTTVFRSVAPIVICRGFRSVFFPAFPY